ncbi:hypothetical protein LINPERPRIM_LOCUS18592 [Linum perenne]
MEKRILGRNQVEFMN